MVLASVSAAIYGAFIHLEIFEVSSWQAQEIGAWQTQQYFGHGGGLRRELIS